MQEVSMRHVAFALLFASPFLTSGCSKNSAENASTNVDEVAPAAELYEVKAGTITGNRTPGINSWFRFQKSATGLETGPQGGACIVFRSSDLGYEVAKPACNEASDCEHGSDPSYCDAGAHVCWARPDPAGGSDPFCKRSIDPGAPPVWPAGTNIRISNNAIPVPAGLKPSAQARTIALLKPKVGAPVLVWGDPKPIP
jgi:hypothetical protein